MPPLWPVSSSAWAAVRPKLAVGLRLLWSFLRALLRGAFQWPLGGSAGSWQSRLLDTLEAANSSPVATSFTLCVASEQPSGCNYRLRLFRAVVAADQHVQQVDSWRRRDSFFKCSFSGSSFWTAVDRECCLTRKSALKESFLVLFYGKDHSLGMKYDGKARIPLPGLVGWSSGVNRCKWGVGPWALPCCEGWWSFGSPPDCRSSQQHSLCDKPFSHFPIQLTVGAVLF